MSTDGDDRVTLRFADGKRRTLLKHTPELYELHSSIVELLPKIERECAAFGTLCPRWVKYPGIPMSSMHWRMGSGETYVAMLSEWQRGWSAAQHIDYHRRFAPLPLAWTRPIREVLGLNQKVDDFNARETLAAHGLLRSKTPGPTRSFDDLAAPTSDAMQRAASQGGQALAQMVLTVAMLSDDVEQTTRYCLDSSSSIDDLVRASAVLGLGHVARRFGQVERNAAAPVFSRALKDAGNYVKANAIDAAHDVAYYAGWTPSSDTNG